MSERIIIFDTTTWGWIMLLLGIAIVLVGLSLSMGSGFARWLVIVGYLFAAFLILLGLGAGSRQLVTLARVRSQPYMADEDRRYFRSQARRRMVASGLLVAVSPMKNEPRIAIVSGVIVVWRSSCRVTIDPATANRLA